jgi:hypothetical protein
VNKEVQKLICKAVIRYLESDMKTFEQCKGKAVTAYELDRHLYVPLKELLNTKEERRLWQKIR